MPPAKQKQLAQRRKYRLGQALLPQPTVEASMDAFCCALPGSISCHRKQRSCDDRKSPCWSASELARAAGITAQTASAHLSRLTAAGLLAMERQGRHRYHRLGSAAVAQMLESLMSVAANPSRPHPRKVVTGPLQVALRQAPTCFDHLAGVLAVAIADRMVARGHVELGTDGGRLTDAGSEFLFDLGIDPQPKGKRRGAIFCKPCLDWSERRPHIAGQVGTALCRTCLDRDWVRPVEGSRALTISPAGRLALDQAFGARLLD